MFLKGTPDNELECAAYQQLAGSQANWKCGHPAAQDFQQVHDLRKGCLLQLPSILLSRKMTAIEQVLGVEEFPDDVLMRDLVSTCWLNMSDDMKAACNDRNSNALPRIGKFCKLPMTLLGLIDTSSKLFLKKEVDLSKGWASKVLSQKARRRKR